MAVYYSWIPTIKGKLDLDFMGRSSFFQDSLVKEDKCISIKNLNVNSILNDKYRSDDSLLSLLSLDHPRIYQQQFMNFKLEEKEYYFKGNISIHYDDKKKYSKVDFELEFNGNIVLKNYVSSQNNLQEKKQVQILYVLIKNIIHSHKHHNHKVDTTILVSTDSASWRSNVVDNLLHYLKLLEGRLDRKDFVKHFRKIRSLDSELDGFLAYGRTFFHLCENDPDCKEDISTKYAKLYENTIQSIKAKIKHLEVQVTHTEELHNRIFILYPVLISYYIASKWCFPNWILAVVLIFVLIPFFKRIEEAMKDKYYYHDYQVYEFFIYLKNYKDDIPQATLKNEKGTEDIQKEPILTKSGKRLAWLLKRKNLNWISYGYILFLMGKNKLKSFWHELRM